MMTDEEKRDILIRINNESYTKNDLEYSTIVGHKVKVLIDLTDKLFQEKVKLSPRHEWIEPFLLKLSFHGLTFLNLFKGVEVPYIHSNQNVIVVDEPSIIAILRVILENHLTFCYL